MNDRLVVIVRSETAYATTAQMDKFAEDILEALAYGQAHDFYPNVEANLVKNKWRYRNLTASEVEQYEPVEILSV